MVINGIKGNFFINIVTEANLEGIFNDSGGRYREESKFAGDRIAAVGITQNDGQQNTALPGPLKPSILHASQAQLLCGANIFPKCLYCPTG